MSSVRRQVAHQVRRQVRRQVEEAWPALGSLQVQLVQGNVRVGDTERDAAAHALAEHYAAGRIDRCEYDERIDRVLVARTRGELAPLFRDLPRGPVTPVRASVSTPAPVRRRPASARIPVLPAVLVLAGVAMLVDAPWVLLVGLGLLLLARRTTR